jgi:preprotein translocase subunit YajC
MKKSIQIKQESYSVQLIKEEGSSRLISSMSRFLVILAVQSMFMLVFLKRFQLKVLKEHKQQLEKLEKLEA